VLLRGRPLDLGDVLEEEAASGPPLEPDRDDRTLEPVGDGPGLMEDLDLLGVGPNEVEDLVVRRRRMLQQGRERRDRLSAPGRGVDQEGASPVGQFPDRVQDLVLPGSYAVGEEWGGGGGCCGRRSYDSGGFIPGSGF
jgi:hypothetical protein